MAEQEQNSSNGTGSVRWATACLVLLPGLLVACGSAPQQGQLTTETVLPSDLPPEGADAQEQETTTTTVAAADFDQPVNQATDPLVERPTIADFDELLNDMRGPSADAIEQMKRLVDFLDLPSPTPSQVLDLRVSIGPADDEGLFLAQSELVIRVPDTPDEMIALYQGQFRAEGWNKTADSVNTVDGVEVTELTFRIPGTPGEDVEMVIMVSADPAATVISMVYRNRSAENEELYDQYRNWFSGLLLPSAAEAKEVEVATEGAEGRLTAFFDLEVGTETDAREALVGVLGRGNFQEDESIAQEPGGPLRLINDDGDRIQIDLTSQGGDPNVVEVVVTSTFDLEPIE